MSIKEQIDKVVEEYVDLHEETCSLNRLDGSYEGCDCEVRYMIKDTVESVVEYLSYDMEFKDEAQRKSAVDMYLIEYLNL